MPTIDGGDATGSGPTVLDGGSASSTFDGGESLMGLPPNGELVGVAWLRTLAGLHDDLVATTIPERNPRFAEHGFLQVTAIGIGGRGSNQYTSMQGTLLQLDAWAYNEGSRQVPWGKAVTLLSHVKVAIEGVQPRGRIETLASFDDARLHSALVVREPQRMPEDESMARYMMEIDLYWTRIEEEDQ